MLRIIKFWLDVDIFYMFPIDGKLIFGKKKVEIFLGALIISELEYITWWDKI